MEQRCFTGLAARDGQEAVVWRRWVARSGKVAPSGKVALFWKLLRFWPAEAQLVKSLLVTAILTAAVRRAKCEAFSMGQLERLGAGSGVLELAAGVVRMVLEHV